MELTTDLSPISMLYLFVCSAKGWTKTIGLLLISVYRKQCAKWLLFWCSFNSDIHCSLLLMYSKLRRDFRFIFEPELCYDAWGQYSNFQMTGVLAWCPYTDVVSFFDVAYCVLIFLEVIRIYRNLLCVLDCRR